MITELSVNGIIGYYLSDPTKSKLILVNQS